MRPAEIASEAELEAALHASEFLLFKHSLVCPVSARAFREYEAWAREHPEVGTAWIDVIGRRPWSQSLARRTGVPHESPQAILLRAGAPAWSASHGAITRASLAAAVANARGAPRS